MTQVIANLLLLMLALPMAVALAAPAGQSTCAERLLVAGSEVAGGPEALWWVWPDDDLVRQVEGTENQRSFLVAVSPDQRWVTYYQRSPLATDRFVVDTWVMDLASDERFKLVEGNAPMAWAADSSAVVLGERPSLMATVPNGELVPTGNDFVIANAMRTVLSPDGRFRASVATTPNGAGGVNITDVSSGEPVMDIQTGRGAVELAWSPDSSRLAYTSGVDGPGGLMWRLRIVDMSTQRVALVNSTAEMESYSVVWAPPLPGCP
jgi:hypothetical protein